MFTFLILFFILQGCYGDKRTYDEVTGITTITHVFYVPETEHEHRRRLNHYWDDFHWKKDGSNLDITIGNCHTPSSIDWSDMLINVIYNWNNVPENQDGTGDIYTPTNVTFVADTCELAMIKSYNENLGNEEDFENVLGVAYLSANNDDEIIQISTYMNEYYLSYYTEDQWHQVLCHEIGHGFPLDHQSESGADENTCMDYDSNLGNKYGNYHDVEILDSIYGDYDYEYEESSKPFYKTSTFYIVILLTLFILSVVMLFYIVYNCIMWYCCCCKSRSQQPEQPQQIQEQLPEHGTSRAEGEIRINIQPSAPSLNYV